MTVQPGLPALPARDAAGHKGTFGSVCVVSGCAHPPNVMLGSAVLASIGALRAGAGLCMIAAPEPLLPFMLEANPSATGVPLPVDAKGELVPSGVAERMDAAAGRATVLAIGPGLGTGFAAQQVVMRVVSQELARPVVIDADALNCLALTPNWTHDFRCHAVLTPHPAEFARLAASLALDADPIAPNARASAAERLAQRVGCIVVLKGHGTIVSDGTATWVCRRGNDALSVGGSGDVLTGIIAGLLAQHHRQIGAHACACLGVEAHARAAERWVARNGGTAGMLASELAAEVPLVLPELRGA